jgi:hypothetical protein
MHPVTSDVLAWLGLKAMALAWLLTAGFGSALAQAAAHGGKIQYKSNILSTKRRAVLQCELSAHEWGSLNFIIH